MLVRAAGPPEELNGGGGVGVGEAEDVLDEVGGWGDAGSGEGGGEAVGGGGGEDLVEGFGVWGDAFGFRVCLGFSHGFQFPGFFFFFFFC